MAEKENYQVTAPLPKDFKELDVKINSYTLVLISDLAAIIPED